MTPEIDYISRLEEVNEDVYVIRHFIDNLAAEGVFHLLDTGVDWHKEVERIDNGVKVPLQRRMAYMAQNPTMYQYANFQFPGVGWGCAMQEMAELIEGRVQKPFNSVLLNYYQDGKDVINWHSDKEETLGRYPTIACLNLGATRKFWFRKTVNPNKMIALPKPFSVEVRNGDLLVMGSYCQERYQHAILKEKDVTAPRISLTFRYNFDKPKLNG